MLLRLVQSSVLVAVLATSGHARASMLPLTDTVLVTGPEYLGKFDLPLDGAGSYRITATDLKYLDKPLDTLWFGVFAATRPIATLQGAGTIEFFKQSSEQITLQIYAKPATGLSAGLVNFRTEAIVALPSSLALLGSALMGWSLLRRRRLRADSVVGLERGPSWSVLTRRLVRAIAASMLPARWAGYASEKRNREGRQALGLT